MEKAQRVAAIEADKVGFVGDLLARFASEALEKGHDAFVSKGTNKLMKMSAERLLEISDRAKDFNTFHKVVFEGYTINAFGSLTQDLVFFPIAACRIYDSRLATGALAGPMAPGTQRDVSVNDSTATQGGASPDCSTAVPDLNNDPPALAITLTAAGPTGPGNLRTFASGGAVPNASMLTYTAGTTLSTGAVTASNPSASLELTVRNQGAGNTDVVIDIVGYFHAPNVSALECTTVTGTPVTIAAGAFAFVNAGAACPAGYTQISLNCDTSSFLGDLAGWRFSSRDCFLRNESGGNITVTASLQCCRVPGR
jgi:hypothetical protein